MAREGSALTLLTGGARSGKSSAAEQLATAIDAPVVLIATATAGDDEMAERIRRHRASRPADWTVVEEPVAVGAVLRGVDPDATVVLDCLSLWVTNQLDDGDDTIIARAAEVADALAVRPGVSIVVTNEVGSGIVPAHELARRFRDVLGLVNQRFVQVADRALLCVAGGVVPVTPMEDLS